MRLEAPNVKHIATLIYILKGIIIQICFMFEGPSIAYALGF